MSSKTVEQRVFCLCNSCAKKKGCKIACYDVVDCTDYLAESPKFCNTCYKKGICDKANIMITCSEHLTEKEAVDKFQSYFPPIDRKEEEIMYIPKEWEDKDDNVNHPKHYETGKFESIDAMLETQGKEAVQDFCICNAFKYIWRHKFKNGVEDIRKAKWYIDKYLELEDEK